MCFAFEEVLQEQIEEEQMFELIYREEYFKNQIFWNWLEVKNTVFIIIWWYFYSQIYCNYMFGFHQPNWDILQYWSKLFHEVWVSLYLSCLRVYLYQTRQGKLSLFKGHLSISDIVCCEVRTLYFHKHFKSFSWWALWYF